MRIGAILWPGYEPLFLARQLGLLDKRQIRLVEYSSMTEVGRAFRNGTVEGIAITLDMALLFQQQGLDPRVVLVIDYSTGADAVIARPEIHSLRDLKGRRVGVEDSGVNVFMLGRALAHAGLRPADLQIVRMPIDQQLRAFQEGQVDAVVTSEPIAGQLQEAGARRLFDSSQIPGEILDVIVVRGESLTEHEEQLRHLGEAWFSALAYLEEHPEDAIARMSPRLQMSQEDLSAALEGIRFPGLEENRALLTGPQPGLIEHSERVQRLLLEQGLLQWPVDPESLPASHALEGGG